MIPTEGDVVLCTQLSIQLALARPYPATDEALASHTAKLISGRNGSILEVLPELGYFRDIVFHFKHAVSGKAQTADDVPKNKTFSPSDATLHWTAKKNENGKDDPKVYYKVHAFEGHPQEYVDVVASDMASKSHFKSFLSLFTSKQKAVRSRLSAADATTVVNSCGDKFLTKKYVLNEWLLSWGALDQLELVSNILLFLVLFSQGKTSFSSNRRRYLASR